MPALTSLFQSEGFSGNVIEVQDLLKDARAKAMSQNTFVWLGFSATSTNGSPGLVASAIAGKSGLSSDLSNNNYVAVMKPMVLRNLQIVNSTTNARILALAGLNTTNNTDLSLSPYTFSQAVSGKSTTFSNVVVFSPDGEATLNTTQMFQWIGIGLQAGPASATNAQVAAIQVSGLCGRPTLYRQ